MHNIYTATHYYILIKNNYFATSISSFHMFYYLILPRFLLGKLGEYLLRSYLLLLL